MTNKLRRALAGAAVALALAVEPAVAAGVTLNESGSSLFFPLFQTWIAGYRSVAPEVALSAASTGSGAGIKAALAGSVRIGASDAYLSDRVAEQNPEILNIRSPSRLRRSTTTCRVSTARTSRSTARRSPRSTPARSRNGTTPRSRR